ncbi:MAG: hypothetical protein H6Q43_3771, partial [Deltaproteobacteria bacterium]|nr:hypothetical protein [Deltaproteobacteria bacterium]
ITTVYEFEKTLLSEAWKTISKHLDVFRAVRGFTLSAQVMDREREPQKAQIRA